MSFSVSTPCSAPSSPTTAAAVRSCIMTTSTTSASVDPAPHTIVPPWPRRSPTCAGRLSAEPTACARSVAETTPATPPGDITTRWWTACSTILVAQCCTESSVSTARNVQSLRRPRNHGPTCTDNGTCSTKARKASRGVTTPWRPEAARAPSATRTQFCREERICRSTCSSGVVLLHTGSALCGFITSAAVLPPTLRATSSSGQAL
mmetsp:Transcript_18615/g.52974  ORF Transcript_18615/g.52974 Transcript_18615/m.52974 type:complete len:206 (+) Transcript_18615:31-648(+)